MENGIHFFEASASSFGIEIVYNRDDQGITTEKEVY